MRVDRFRVLAGALALATGAGLAGVQAASSVPAAAPQPSRTIQLAHVGTYASGIYNEGGDVGAAEIVAHDPATQTLFVSNAISNTLDLVNIANPARPTKSSTVQLAPYGAVINSVAVKNGVVAVALENAVKQQPGQVAFFTTAGAFVKAVTVGALPDMLAFTPDGTRVLVANEGEPDQSYTVDPEGSISIIDLSGGVASLTQANVSTVGFADFNIGGARRAEFDPRIRVFGPGATVAKDLEPEYISVAPDGATAWVTLQENNAVAIIDIAQKRVSAIKWLGLKNWATAGGLDASDRDGGINIRAWAGVKGMYQPDAIATFQSGSATYRITANEGDSRDYDGYSEEERASAITLNTSVFTQTNVLSNTNLGRLRVTSAYSDTTPANGAEELWTFGARSFSIWGADGTLVYDSGALLEQITAAAEPANFNSTSAENASFDTRSDDKGPEPEAVTVGVVNGRTYAFIGMERLGGIMVFDVTTPTAPVFVQYVNNRNFAGDPANGSAGDLAPEGIIFIAAADSPTGRPLVVTANEVSGTTSLFEVARSRLYVPVFYR